MMRKLLERITLRLPIRPIYHAGGLYLKRYYVGTIFGVRIYLHHFLLDDPDGLHNHPWKYGFSIILAGWYWEERRWEMRKIRWWNVVNADCLHRVCLGHKHVWDDKAHDKYPLIKLDSSVWSLFFHTARVCDWAFIRPLPAHWDNKVAHAEIRGGDICIDNISCTATYHGVYKEKPTPFSDWHKTAPTGAKWEAEQQRNACLQKYGPMIKVD